MPWVQIPTDRIQHLPFFGFDQIAEDDNGIWFSTPNGRMFVDRISPKIFVDDVNDIMQLNPLAILVEPNDG